MKLPEEGHDFEHRRRANAELAKVVAAGLIPSPSDQNP